MNNERSLKQEVAPMDLMKLITESNILIAAEEEAYDIDFDFETQKYNAEVAEAEAQKNADFAAAYPGVAKA